MLFIKFGHFFDFLKLNCWELPIFALFGFNWNYEQLHWPSEAYDDLTLGISKIKKSGLMSWF
jgi:hypothetical protein